MYSWGDIYPMLGTPELKFQAFFHIV